MCIDPAVLAEIIELERQTGEPLLADVARHYSSNGRNQLAALRDTIAGGSCNDIAKTAHALRSSSATTGAAAVAAACAAIEFAALDGNIAEAQARLPDVATAFDAACAALDCILKEINR